MDAECCLRHIAKGDSVFEGLHKIVIFREMREAIWQKDQLSAPNIELPDIEIAVNRGGIE